MESNNYNSVHILSEAVIMGGISMYFYKKISELESTIEDLKTQITMQNNQIRYLLGGSSHLPNTMSFSSGFGKQPPSTPLRIPPDTTGQRLSPPQKEHFSNDNIQHTYLYEQQQRQQLPLPPQQQRQPVTVPQTENMECEGGVCRLVPRIKTNGSGEGSNKKVAISKISKQIEFDRDNMEPDQTIKVNTFANSSPNPVLKSVTPKPSTSVSETTTTAREMASDLEKILNDIDDE